VTLVIDTDMVSFLYKQDTHAELYRPHLTDPPFIIAVMTLAELRSWMRHRKLGGSPAPPFRAVSAAVSARLCDRCPVRALG
jgi:hypothetical protein